MNIIIYFEFLQIYVRMAITSEYYYLFWIFTDLCTDGYVFSPKSRVCYKVFPTVSITQIDAEANCVADNARLPIVDTEDKYYFFASLVQPHNPGK